MAKMLAHLIILITFDTAFMPVAFAVPTMTVFLFALLGARLVASVVVSRFDFFATVDHTSPTGALNTDDSTDGTGTATLRGTLDTDDSTGGNATLGGGRTQHRRLDGW